MTARQKLERFDVDEGRLERMRDHIETTVQQRGSGARLSASPDLLAWGRCFLPDHFRLPPSAMHRWMAGRLDGMHAERGQKVNVVGPRGGAKSTVGTLALVLRAAVEAREPYIWIVSDTSSQARSHLENLKIELTDNSRLAAAYPGSVGPGRPWRSGAIALRNGVRVEAFGTGQRIRGRRRRAHRPTLIVCDDLQNDQHIESRAARARSRAWFHGTLMKAGTKRTGMLCVATALHREALALELHATPGWNSRVFRAIETWPENMSMWHQWEDIYSDADNPAANNDAWHFYETRRESMHAGAALLWPDEEDLYTLMCMRAESGRTAFEREKQSSPIDPELCEWPESYFGEWLWFDEWPDSFLVKTVALDPSKGQDARRGDYSAFVLLGVHPSGLLYVEADLARRPTPQMVADGVEHCRRFRPQALGIEGNQYQQLLDQEFQSELLRQNVTGMPIWTLDNRVNKLVRIRRLGPLLASRRLRFKSRSLSTKLLVEQLRDFPAGEHDDGPDAAEMAIRLADELMGATGPNDGLGERLI